MKRIYGAAGIAAGFIASIGMFAIGGATAAYFLAIEPASEPGPSVDVADLWTAKPRTVDSAAQDFERLPAAPSVPTAAVAAPPASSAAPRPSGDALAAAPAPQDADEEAPLDGVTTAALQTEDAAPPVDLVSDHVAWCFDRYRSYRVEDDSFTPYGGGRRPCVSPWSGEIAAWAKTAAAGGYADDGYANDGYADDGAVDADLEARYQQAMDDGSLGGPIVRGAEGGALFYAASEPDAYALSPAHVADCFARYRSYRPADNSYQPYGGGPRRQCR